MTTALFSWTLLALCVPPVETAATPTTRLYIRTSPPDANVRVDEKLLGKSDGLFLVPPGVRRIVVELEGHYPQQQQIEIRGGQVTRLELELQKQPEADNKAAKTNVPAEPVATDQSEPPKVAAQPGFTIPERAVRLGYVDDSAEDKRSFGGSGYAVAFDRPEGAKQMIAVQFYGSRYGHPQPPAEDFHVYLLDKDQKVLKDLAYPYAMIERGEERWYSLPVTPPVEVPEKFSVALSFNAHQTKGVYLGMDRNVKESHSSIGLPDKGFKSVKENYDWMIRGYLAPKAAGKEN